MKMSLKFAEFQHFFFVARPASVKFQNIFINFET